MVDGSGLGEGGIIVIISTVKSSGSVVILSTKSNVVCMTVVLSDEVHGSSERVRHASPRFLMDLMYCWDWDWRLNTARGLRSLDAMVPLIGAWSSVEALDNSGCGVYGRKIIAYKYTL